MRGEYSKEVDVLMNELMDRFDFVDNDYCTAKLGSIEIWVADAPYARMIPYISNCIKPYARPSRLTIQRGIKKLNSDRIKKIRKDSGIELNYEN